MRLYATVRLYGSRAREYQICANEVKGGSAVEWSRAARPGRDRWAARDEDREPQTRMQALQENLLRSVCAWVSNEHLTGPGRLFA